MNPPRFGEGRPPVPGRKRRGDARRQAWHAEPLPAAVYGPGPAGTRVRLARRGDLVMWAAQDLGWAFRAFLTPSPEQEGLARVWQIVGTEEEGMPKITKANALWQAERIEEAIDAPGPGGVPVTIAAPGDWVCYAETPDGELIFKQFLTDLEYREKFVRVAGGLEASRR